MVASEMGDPVIAQRFRVVGVVTEYFKGISVEPVQTVARTDPYIAAFILHTTGHHVIA